MLLNRRYEVWTQVYLTPELMYVYYFGVLLLVDEGNPRFREKEGHKYQDKLVIILKHL